MGPTAAGKTELALELARRFDAEIVSVDSAQVYRGMDIGTAKPAASLRAEVQHHLIDIRDPAQAYSAAEFRADALAAVSDIAARGRVPLLAGGTMLYFRALTEGLSALPSSDPALRAELDALERVRGTAHLHRRLAGVDPASARRIHPNDPQRLKRALEVHELAGRPMSELLERGRERLLPPDCLKLALVPDERAMLHRRIESRFRSMLERGLVDEVRALHRRSDLHEDLPAIRSVGYRQVWQYLDARLDYQAMSDRAVAATRQLAKRQLTWLRGEAELVRLKENGDFVFGEASRHMARFLAAKA